MTSYRLIWQITGFVAAQCLNKKLDTFWYCLSLCMIKSIFYIAYSFQHNGILNLFESLLTPKHCPFKMCTSSVTLSKITFVRPFWLLNCEHLFPVYIYKSVNTKCLLYEPVETPTSRIDGSKYKRAHKKSRNINEPL